LDRNVTKNKDGTYKVVESNIVESVTRENLVMFRDKLREDITRLEKNVADLKKQEKDIIELLKE
jgi:polyhydroxyalkanoate synthesis regulator phasin